MKTNIIAAIITFIIINGVYMMITKNHSDYGEYSVMVLEVLAGSLFIIIVFYLIKGIVEEFRD